MSAFSVLTMLFLIWVLVVQGYSVCENSLCFTFMCTCVFACVYVHVNKLRETRQTENQKDCSRSYLAQPDYTYCRVPYLNTSKYFL